MAYQGGTDEQLTIQNDNMSEDDYIAFMDAFFTRYREAVRDTASLYICVFSGNSKPSYHCVVPVLRCATPSSGQKLRAFGFWRYKFQHEPIFYCHVKGQSDKWYGDLTQTTVWQEKKPAANRLHPTMKPVEIVQRAVVNSSKRGDIVLDLFMGSGTTLIAAQTLGRRCYGMELDPRYADVAVERWQNHTGKKAVRITSAGRHVPLEMPQSGLCPSAPGQPTTQNLPAPHCPV